MNITAGISEQITVELPFFPTEARIDFNPTMPQWMVRSLDIFNGILAFYMATFGVLWNLMALVFFLQSKKDVIKIIYISITIIDLLTCLLMAPIGVSDLDFRKGHFFSNRILCNAHGFLWNIAARLSVFLVMVLSVTRTMYLLFPFKNISKRSILIMIVVYTIMQFLQASVPFAVSMLSISKQNLQCTQTMRIGPTIGLRFNFLSRFKIF